ncbi:MULTISPECIES: DUF3710 domain-containing protein [unclassified Curtobacterium]|uniref:DUF3710 domain-containing protein n=1 Tax=unclassified Curtobacterium TaxID=257496 RepID=UPI000B0B81DE|nr:MULTISPECIES: DUF3710 domain-containing protein [unclassified Curtobacterium]MBP1300500.1 hypothetical protein [Curtobacterium sp. 1310]MCM3505159.1 DUF3710 domain-containing protein [Curtobacterium sp. ODYSSEY 48 V2]MCM3523176.1 DUF3710 domain-containing protein [Curtobacterium sp. P97]MDB6427507.1 DUF3710 domain-containing protein [Curtobacterium sp. 20TX0008]MDT0209292.1 DUF3710 domain-containing protein [Curtobacterium sp. BRD11]
MKFGRRKRDEVEVADAVADDAVIAGTTPEVDIATDADADLDEVDAVAPTDKSAPADRADNGPHDETEANLVRPYVDLGGVKVLPREGLHLRLEVEEGSQRVVAVGLDYDESTLQVQPFAAPRSTGLWHEIRAQIADQIERQGGRVDEVDGPFGPELRALVPVVVDGSGATDGARAARFVGVDGPRWFLRGVIAGKAAEQPDDAAEIEELFRSVVVVRGTTPMPPRDLIPLHMPKSTQTAV